MLKWRENYYKEEFFTGRLGIVCQNKREYSLLCKALGKERSYTQISFIYCYVDEAGEIATTCRWEKPAILFREAFIFAPRRAKFFWEKICCGHKRYVVKDWENVLGCEDMPEEVWEKYSQGAHFFSEECCVRVYRQNGKRLTTLTPCKKYTPEEYQKIISCLKQAGKRFSQIVREYNSACCCKQSFTVLI